jgi:hypothetical protein
MGQQSGNVARLFAARQSRICATRKKCFKRRPLDGIADLLCCVRLDAAMHKHKAGQPRELQIERMHHRDNANIASTPSFRAVLFTES